MSDVYTAFKPIRNKIRKYTPISIIGMAIDIMHSHIDSVDTVEQWLRPHSTYLPHTIMLMIRLVYQCSEANPNARDITSNEFKELHFAIYKLADNVGLSLSGQESVNKGFSFLKRIMNQQIMYQVKDYEVHAAFSRQLILFEDMGSDYDINNKFMEIAGITLKEFFQISFSCWTMLNIKENRHLSISMLEHIFPTNYLQGFFRIVSRDIDGAKKYIRQHPG